MTVTLPTTLEEFCHVFAGNWREFNCFIWWDRPADAERWGIHYTHNRDSELLTVSNAAVILKEMKAFISRGSALVERHNHWACGWIQCLVVKVYDRRGIPTQAVRKLWELKRRLADYPVLDDEDYANREHESALDAIEQQVPRGVRDRLPDSWTSEVLSWLWDHEQGELENTDDRGACPSEASVERARAALGYLDLGEVDWDGDRMLAFLNGHPGLSISDGRATELGIADEWSALKFNRQIAGEPFLPGMTEEIT